MKRLGVLGGSFDPVHTGHLIVAQDVLTALSLDEILLIPAGTPPHKKRRLASGEDRLRMIDLAVRGDTALRSSAIELERGGVSYTIDTLKELRRDVPKDTEVYFIVGFDNLPELHEWKNPWELVELCTLVTIGRPGYEHVAIPKELAGRHMMVEVTSIDISSRDIRDRIRKGLPIRYHVPEKVEEYIREKKLYRESERA